MKINWVEFSEQQLKDEYERRDALYTVLTFQSGIIVVLSGPLVFYCRALPDLASDWIWWTILGLIILGGVLLFIAIIFLFNSFRAVYAYHLPTNEYQQIYKQFEDYAKSMNNSLGSEGHFRLPSKVSTDELFEDWYLEQLGKMVEVNINANQKRVHQLKSAQRAWAGAFLALAFALLPYTYNQVFTRQATHTYVTLVKSKEEANKIMSSDKKNDQGRSRTNPKSSSSRPQKAPQGNSPKEAKPTRPTKPNPTGFRLLKEGASESALKFNQPQKSDTKSSPTKKNKSN